MADQNRDKFIEEKLYNSIEKLADVSSNLSKLVATHSVRLDYIEKNSDEIKESIDRLTQSVQKYNNDDNVQHDLFSQSLENLKDKLDHTVVSTTQHSNEIEDFDRRIKKLEMWKYYITGGAVMLGIFASRVFEFILVFFTNFRFPK